MDVLEQLRLRRLALRELVGVTSLPQMPARPDELRSYQVAPPQEYVCPPPPPPNEALDRLQQNRAAVTLAFRGMNPSHYPEIGRILALPVEGPMTEAEADDFSRRRVLATAYQAGFRLHPVQAQAVRDFERWKGLLAPIGVGWGKTLVTLMIADSAFRTFSRKSVLMVPSQVYDQLVLRDIAWARHRIPLTVPFIYLGKTSARTRMTRAQTGRAGCYVMPYSILSTRDAETLIHEVWPDLLILDEAHLVKNPKSARTRRLMGLIREARPALAALSGTLTSKSLMDYHHLAIAALGECAPVPIPTAMATDWASVIDAEGGLGNEEVLEPIVTWCRRTFPYVTIPWDRSGYRSAFRLRLTSAPGVVATGDAELGISLTLANSPAAESKNEYLDYKEMEAHSPGLAECARLMKQVEDEFVTPDGDEIDYAIHCFKWLYELSHGFYYSLRWPTADMLAQKRSISDSEASAMLLAAQRHHASKQAYHKMLRSWISENASRGLDTPMLVAGEMVKHGQARVGADLYKAWMEMKEQEFDNMPERYRVPVPVSDFKIAAAIEWAKHHRPVKDRGSLIWYRHQYIGEWLFYAMKQEGLDVVYCPAGANETITDPSNERKIIIASIKAHGTGKNLQAFQNTYIVQFPREARDLEQVLGRNHRRGQEADELIVTTNLTLQYDYLIVSAALNDALYIQQSTGQRQKAVYAGYNPLPRLFPYDVLVERGLKPLQLDEAGRQKFQSLSQEIPT